MIFSNSVVNRSARLRLPGIYRGFYFIKSYGITDRILANIEMPKLFRRLIVGPLDRCLVVEVHGSRNG